jgi:hypothetical protein
MLVATKNPFPPMKKAARFAKDALAYAMEMTEMTMDKSSRGQKLVRVE